MNTISNEVVVGEKVTVVFGRDVHGIEGIVDRKEDDHFVVEGKTVKELISLDRKYAIPYTSVLYIRIDE